MADHFYKYLDAESSAFRCCPCKSGCVTVRAPDAKLHLKLGFERSAGRGPARCVSVPPCGQIDL